MIDMLDKRFLSVKTVKPRTTLVREGMIAREMYFIQSGCIRAWLNNAGREITLQFFFEGESVTALESFLKKTPSTIYIEAIEPCELYTIDRQDFFENLEKESMRRHFYDTAIEKLIFHGNRLTSLLKNKPVERYRQLLTESPHIIRRVPQHYVASYLGITSVSLSRIRNRVKE